MSETNTSSTPAGGPVVVVTGANGLVGARTCAALAERGATVRALVRRSGSAPVLDGVEEHVGEFHDPEHAAKVVEGADAVVTTVHPMGTEYENQRRIGVEGTEVIARAARDAGVDRLVHISTAAVYDRSPGAGDVAEDFRLVGDDGNAYAVTKRDTDAALAEIDGLTRVILHPPAILGSSESSIWNAVRPAGLRDDESQRHVNPEQTFAWVHVDDLAALAADVASGRIAAVSGPDASPDSGPVASGCTHVIVAAEPAKARDYYRTVADALGFEMHWDDGEAWTGILRTDRARSWGWKPAVDLPTALVELDRDLRDA